MATKGALLEFGSNEGIKFQVRSARALNRLAAACKASFEMPEIAYRISGVEVESFRLLDEESIVESKWDFLD